MKNFSDREASASQSAKDMKKKSQLTGSSSKSKLTASALKQTMLVKPPTKKTGQSSNATSKTAS